MRRVAIHGVTGSGKSTLAKALANKLRVPHIELDALWHEPNWKEAEIGVFRERVAASISCDGWVVDGNYKQSVDLVYARADTILMLDYPLPLILWRLNGRVLQRGITRQELWNGNRESAFRHYFTRESLFLWAFKTYRRRRAYCREVMADSTLGHIERMVFRRPRELTSWFKSARCDFPSVPTEGSPYSSLAKD